MQDPVALGFTKPIASWVHDRISGWKRIHNCVFVSQLRNVKPQFQYVIFLKFNILQTRNKWFSERLEVSFFFCYDNWQLTDINGYVSETAKQQENADRVSVYFDFIFPGIRYLGVRVGNFEFRTPTRNNGRSRDQNGGGGRVRRCENEAKQKYFRRL